MTPENDEIASVTMEVGGFLIERPIIRASGSGRVREADAARYLGCSESKLRHDRYGGNAPKHSMLHGRAWYHINDLEAWIAAYVVDPAA